MRQSTELNSSSVGRYPGNIVPVIGPYWPPAWHCPQPSLRVSPVFVFTSVAHPVHVNDPGIPQARSILPIGMPFTFFPLKPYVLNPENLFRPKCTLSSMFRRVSTVT